MNSRCDAFSYAKCVLTKNKRQSCEECCPCTEGRKMRGNLGVMKVDLIPKENGDKDGEFKKECIDAAKGHFSVE